jgi:hypothetical protein
MTSGTKRGAIALAIILIAAGVVYEWRERTAPTPAAKVATAEPPAETEPPLASPTTNPDGTADTEPALESEVAAALGFTNLPDFVYTDRLLRRFVATVDALPRAQVSLGVRAIRPVRGTFMAEGSDDKLRVAPANDVRYDDIVAALERVEPAAAAELYQRLYPRLQQTYEELGYPGHSFHARLVEVIDQLLATPQLPAAAELVRPNVEYLYADPAFEHRSAGQKALMRLGPKNETRVKARLRAIRAQLVTRPQH